MPRPKTKTKLLDLGAENFQKLTEFIENLGYTWKTAPALNLWIWEKYQATPLSEAKQLLNQSFKKLRTIINQHSNEELFTKKKYKWTGSTSLGSYLVSATSSHYDWGLKLIKKAKK